jgi:hypothetical protein
METLIFLGPMAEVLVIFSGLLFISFMYFFVYKYGNKLLKKQYAPLLSIIEGRIYLKCGMTTVVEGLWQGVKVKAEASGNKCPVPIITLWSSCSLPFSLKIRPTSGALGLVDMGVGALFDGHRFKIPESNITVYSPAGDETMIRQFINPARISIIRDIFSRNFNYFEIRTDPIAGDYLKVTIEPSRLPMMMSNPLKLYSPYQKICQTALQPEAVSHILEQLKEFETAEFNTKPLAENFSASLSGS